VRDGLVVVVGPLPGGEAPGVVEPDAGAGLELALGAKVDVEVEVLVELDEPLEGGGAGLVVVVPPEELDGVLDAAAGAVDVAAGAVAADVGVVDVAVGAVKVPVVLVVSDVGVVGVTVDVVAEEPEDGAGAQTGVRVAATASDNPVAAAT
jgi:hypothetical protein